MQSAPQLTKEQQKVIDLKEGKHLVLAPPGCGKTELLAMRVEEALRSGYKENELICLTFTNRAARGMKERVEQKFATTELLIGNIHHYCSRFLFKNNLVPQCTSFLDEEEAELLLEEIKEELDYPKPQTDARGTTQRPKVFNGELFKYSAYLQQQQLGLDDTLLPAPHLPSIPQPALAREVCLRYQKIKEEYDLLDFDDVLIKSLVLLRKKKAEWALCHYTWMQVDEVQDLNPLQWAIIEELLHPGAVQVYFGDPQQAIFSFMGARPHSLTALQSQCQLHHLTRNFRSPSYLLEVFNDYARTALQLGHLPEAHKVAAGSAGCLKLFKVKGTLHDEAQCIVTHLLPEFQQKGSEVAIIVRMNQTAESISRILDFNEIEHFKISGYDLFRRKICKDLIAFLSVLSDEFDAVSWARMLYLFGKVKSLKESRNLTKELFRLGLPPSDLLCGDGLQTEAMRFFDHFTSKRLVIFDTETTGLDVENEDIIQIAAVEIGGGKRGQSFNRYIKTARPLGESVAVHHITEQTLEREGVAPAEGLAAFLEFLGDDSVLVAHNIAFDLAVLKANLQRHCSREYTPAFTADTLRISQLVWPRLRSYKLAALLKQLKLEGNNTHNAVDDVAATANLVFALVKDGEPLLYRQRVFLQSNQTLVRNFREGLMELYSYCRSRYSTPTPIIEIIRQYFNTLRAGSTRAKASTLEVELPQLNRLFRHIQCNEALNSASHLLHCLESFAQQYTSCKESDLIIGDEKIFLSTVYKAKGLEFDNVIVAEAVSENYPHWNSWTEEQRLEDARALYVAMSRAKERLYITTHSQHITPWNAVKVRTPSPFLQCIEHHFDVVETAPYTAVHNLS